MDENPAASIPVSQLNQGGGLTRPTGPLGLGTSSRDYALEPPWSDHLPRLSLAREVWNNLAHLSAAHLEQVWIDPEGCPWVRAEWIDGPSLEAIAPLPIQRVMKIVEDLADLLHQLHQRGWVHGNLRAASIRLRPEGIPVVTNGWFCRPVATQAVLTPSWADAREREAVVRPDIAADVYALSWVARGLLCGHGETPGDLLTWDVLHTQRASAQLHDARALTFLSLLNRMGSENPRERPSDLAPLLRLLRDKSEVEETTAFAQPPLLDLSRPVALIREKLLDAPVSSPPVFWLAGAEETGKTRVAETVVRAASAEGWCCFYVNSAEPDLPFDTWYRLISTLLNVGDPETMRELRADYHHCHTAFFDRPPYDVIAAEIARIQMARIGRRILAALPRGRRYLVVFDSWERADEATQTTLLSLMQGDETAPEPEVRWLIAGQQGPPDDLPASYLKLEKWSIETFASWVTAKLNQAKTPKRFVEQLYTFTGGSAYFTDLALKHLQLTGVLKRHEGTWRVPETLWPGALPRDTASLCSTALSRLSPAALHLQAHFSALPHGRLLLDEGNGYGLWKNSTNLAAVAEWLDSGLAVFDVAQVRLGVTLGKAGVNGADPHEISAAQAGWFSRFDALPPSEGVQRVRLMPLRGHAAPPHRQAAAFLELGQLQMATDCREACLRSLNALRSMPIEAKSADDYAMLEAWLDAHAPVPSKDELTPPWRQAPQEEEAGAAPMRAAAWWLRLRVPYLALQDRPADALRASLCELVGFCSSRCTDLAVLIALDVAAGDLRAGRHAQGIEVLKIRVKLPENQSPYLGLRAEALLIQLSAAEVGHRLDTCARLRDLVSQQAACGDEAGHLVTLTWLMEAEAALGQWPALQKTAKEARALSARLRNSDAHWYSQLLLCRALGEMGALDAAVSEVQVLKEIAATRPHPTDAAVAQALYFWLMTELGRFQAVNAGLFNLLNQELPADPLRLMLSRVALARSLATTGYADQALAVLQEGIFQLRGQREGEALPALQSALAQLHAFRGDSQAALSTALEALSHLSDGRHPHWQLQTLLARSAAYLLQGHAAAGTEAAQQARDLAENLHAQAALALANIYLGEAALARNLPSAGSYFQSAHLGADEIGHPLLKARALDGWGRSDPLAGEAATRFGDAQRLVQKILALLPPDAKSRSEQTPWIAALLDRTWSGGGWLLLKPETHRSTLDRLGAVSAELSGLTSHYGLMIRAWTARRAQLSKLNELARTVNESLSLDEVAGNVLRVTLDLTGAERAFTLLKSQGRYNDLIVRAGINRAGEAINEQPLSMSVCWRVFQRGEPWAVLDGLTSKGTETGQSIAALNLKTVMAAPLESKGTPFGVLYVDSKAASQTYTLQDLEQLAALAAHASCAIENALLYETLVKRTVQLEAQLCAVRAAEREANLDPLTGLRNRRAFLSRANQEVSLARRKMKALSLILLDVDHFKAFNDEYGHAVGDQVLVAVTQCVAQRCRESDLLARLGGEEFVILCPETAPDEALTLARRLTGAVQGLRLLSPEGKALPVVTLSGGTAGWQPEDATIETVLARADAALYRAKQAGRNLIHPG